MKATTLTPTFKNATVTISKKVASKSKLEQIDYAIKQFSKGILLF